MINKNNLKKYLLFLITCFISLIGITFAENTNTLDGMKYQDVRYIQFTQYDRFDCRGEGTLKVLSIEKLDVSYKVTFANLPTEDGTDTIVCDWSKRSGIGGKNENGTNKYYVSYHKETERNIEITINGSVNLQEQVIDIKARLGASEIVSVNPTQNSEYMDYSQCSSSDPTKCLVNATKEAISYEVLKSSVDITYKIASSSENLIAHITFLISINGGARAYPGNFGTCQFDSSQWHLENRGGYTFWETNTLNDIVFPNCGSENSAFPVVFKGWTSTPIETSSRYPYKAQQTGICASAYNAIPGGEKVTATTGMDYFPCYEFAKGIMLVGADGVDIENISSCTKINANNTYFCQSETDQLLPNATLSGVYNQGKKIKGWIKSSNGQTLDIGTSVPSNGEIYTINIERTVEDISYYRSIYVGDKQPLVINDMKSCEIINEHDNASGHTSSHLKAEFKEVANECQITGLKVTDPNEYVDILVTDSEKTYTYKFTVESNLGQNEVDPDSLGFVVDVDPNIFYGQNDQYTNESNFFTTKRCINYSVASRGQDASFGSSNGVTLYSSSYVVTNTGDCGDYIALCLDPGRLGPSSAINYNQTAEVRTSSDFGKLIAYIAQDLNSSTAINNFKNVGSPERIAALIAIRTVAIMDGYSGGVYTIDSLLASHYNAYAKFAAALKEVYNDNFEAKTSSEKTSAITTVVNNNFSFNSSNIKTILIRYLANYKSYNPDVKESFERTVDSTTYEEVGNGYVLTYKGTLSLPYGAKLSRIDGFTYDVVKGEITYTKNDELSETNREVYDYTVTITVSDASKVIPPTQQNDKNRYSFKIVYSDGTRVDNIFIGNPSGSAVMQRMVFFKVDSNEINTYFDITPNTENACNTLPALDYKACYDEDNNYICDSSSTFNPSLFKGSNCCKYVLDEQKYGYIVNNVCNSKCSVSTMRTACTINTCSEEDEAAGLCQTGTSEIYTIKEGASYNYNATEGKGTYANNIGTCIVKVDQAISSSDDKNSFNKVDDNGNSIMVQDYNGNRYCRVSCSEEWTIAADGFGNFVGQNAITAGSYFSIKTPIYIGGQRTCYTTYIDYEKYFSDLSSASARMVTAYNDYSAKSHQYSAIESSAIDYVSEGGNAADKLEFTSVRYCMTETEHYDTVSTTEYGSAPVGGKCESGYSLSRSGRSCTKSGTKKVQNGYDCTQWSDASPETDVGTYTLTVSDLFNNPAQGVHTTYPGGGNVDYPQPKSSATTCTKNPPAEGHVAETVTGDCFTKDVTGRQKAYDKLKSSVMPDLGSMKEDLGTISGAKADMESYEQQMFDCQHFQVYNISDDDKGRANNLLNSVKLEDDVARTPIRINTAFEPEISYTYDEAPYMTILGKDNVLEEFTALNDKYYQLAGYASYGEVTNVSVPAALDWYVPNDITNDNLDKLINEQTDAEGNVTKVIELTRNKISNHYYNPSGPWVDTGATKEAFENYHDASHEVAGTNEYVSYLYCSVSGAYTGGTASTSYVKEGATETDWSGGEFHPYWRGGSCSGKRFYYIKAHYIKSTLSNSSFYKNKGNWYTNSDGTKEHGQDKISALKNGEKRTGVTYDTSDDALKLWRKLGSRDSINDFPITLTTPRNLYQYTYTFGKMGTFEDGRLGRIMGAGSLSVISSNNRTCFYEIVESVCLCCGDPIVSYAVEGVPSPGEYLSVHEDEIDYELSDEDEIQSGSNGTLGFSNTTVSLNDLNAVGKAGGRDLATNWSDKDVYRLSNLRFHTGKGQMALEAIETVGEKIYDETPEYSFQLSPQTLASIREYNDQYGYGINFSRLKPYGIYAIEPLGECTDINNCQWQPGGSYSNEYFSNNVPYFIHYGSKFLEEFMTDYASSNGLSRLTGNDNVCVIKEGQTANDLLNLTKTGNCRWIDYINNEEVSDLTETNILSKKSKYYRLAFK